MILDLAAGAGGWEEGLEALGRIDTVGIEINPTYCHSAESAGHTRIQGDISTLDPLAVGRQLGPIEGLIASPPCQTFSAAGWRQGVEHLDRLVAVANDFRGGQAMTHFELTQAVGDENTAMVLEPLRYIQALNPAWVALEQVPIVMPLWQAIAHLLRDWGYSVWTGKLNAEQYGVPQVRERAVLMATRTGLAVPPRPTHSKYYIHNAPRLDPGVARWVTMGEALGWDALPATFPDGTPRIADSSGQPIDWTWPTWRPATTLVGRELLRHPGGNANAKNGAKKSRNDGVKLTPAEASVLQGFRANFPWVGGKGEVFQQIGNAVPPPLATAICQQLLKG